MQILKVIACLLDYPDQSSGGAPSGYRGAR